MWNSYSDQEKAAFTLNSEDLKKSEEFIREREIPKLPFNNAVNVFYSSNAGKKLNLQMLSQMWKEVTIEEKTRCELVYREESANHEIKMTAFLKRMGLTKIELKALIAEYKASTKRKASDGPILQNDETILTELNIDLTPTAAAPAASPNQVNKPINLTQTAPNQVNKPIDLTQTAPNQINKPNP